MLIRGQGLSLATYRHRWELASALGSGARSVRSCTNRSAPTDLVVVDGSSCFVAADGTMTIFDRNASGGGTSGSPIRMLESSGQIEDITQNRLVSIHVLVSAGGLRETDEDSPYSQELSFRVWLDKLDTYQRTIRVVVSAEAVAATSTFVPPSLPPSAEPRASNCSCTNVCIPTCDHTDPDLCTTPVVAAAAARDGVCDDGGPGS